LKRTWRDRRGHVPQTLQFTRVLPGSCQIIFESQSPRLKTGDGRTGVLPGWVRRDALPTFLGRNEFASDNRIRRSCPAARGADIAARGPFHAKHRGTSESIPPKTARNHRLGWDRAVEGTSDFGWERRNCLLHHSVGFAMVACGGKNRDSAESGA